MQQANFHMVQKFKLHNIFIKKILSGENFFPLPFVPFAIRYVSKSLTAIKKNFFPFPSLICAIFTGNCGAENSGI